MIGQERGERKLRVGGSDLRQMLALGTTLLEEGVEQVNALNVFPVPDGDTGTNMLLTMQSALAELSSMADADLSTIAHAAAHGSLMGARGNSGVILSQILRGVARFADGRSSLDAAELANALKEGATTAYRGIGKPVEGTILTVAREAADAALAAAGPGCDAVDVLRCAVEGARRAVQNTPELLATLKEAGVVDAGGQGYLLILEGALMSLSGERDAPPIREAIAPAVRPKAPGPLTDYGYCTEVLIRGRNLRPDDISRRLESLGESVIAVGDENLVHIHVHTKRPGEILELACSLGTLEKVKVENMQLQHTSYLSSLKPTTPIRVEGMGVVAVAAGEGMVRLFRELGAAAVVHGGQSMNPSIEELVHAVTSAGCDSIVLLPNNPNVILTAQKAQALLKVDVRVIPTRTLCQGIAAMVAFSPEAGLEANASSMAAAMEGVHSIEVTRAVRSTKANGLQILQGQAIGLLDGVLVEAGDSLQEVSLRTLDRAQVSEHEVVAIYRGEEVAEDDAQRLADAIQRRWAGLEVETVDGGQPHYPFIISVE